jgi:hypothetical protein
MNVAELIPYVAPAVVAIGGGRWIANYMISRFESRFNSLHEALAAIQVQTTATNGRISALERDAAETRGILIGKGLSKE